MPGGLDTLVSDSTLSGGQKQRLSLARAAYSQAPIVLIDDCFSALDPRVASHVFEECVVKLLGERTRIVVSRLQCAVYFSDVIGIVLPADKARALRRSMRGSGTAEEAPSSRSSIFAASSCEIMEHPEAARCVNELLGDAEGSKSDLIDASGDEDVDTANVLQQSRDGPLPASGSVTLGAAGVDDELAALGHKVFPDEPADPGLPILLSWYIGVGGQLFATVYLVLLGVDALTHLGGNYFLTQWVGDPEYKLLGELWKYSECRCVSVSTIAPLMCVASRSCHLRRHHGVCAHFSVCPLHCPRLRCRGGG